MADVPLREAVTRSCGAGRRADVVEGEHQAFALIGASGSGNSTLRRCIDLLEEIDDGDIFLDGEPITVPGLNPVPIRPSSAWCSSPSTCSHYSTTSCSGRSAVRRCRLCRRERRQWSCWRDSGSSPYAREYPDKRDVADQVCFLEVGRIIEQGPPEQILSAPREAATQRFLSRLIEANRL